MTKAKKAPATVTASSPSSSSSSSSSLASGDENDACIGFVGSGPLGRWLAGRFVAGGRVASDKIVFYVGSEVEARQLKTEGYDVQERDGHTRTRITVQRVSTDARCLLACSMLVVTVKSSVTQRVAQTIASLDWTKAGKQASQTGKQASKTGSDRVGREDDKDDGADGQRPVVLSVQRGLQNVSVLELALGPHFTVVHCLPDVRIMLAPVSAARAPFAATAGPSNDKDTDNIGSGDATLRRRKAPSKQTEESSVSSSSSSAAGARDTRPQMPRACYIVAPRLLVCGHQCASEGPRLCLDGSDAASLDALNALFAPDLPCRVVAGGLLRSQLGALLLALGEPCQALSGLGLTSCLQDAYFRELFASLIDEALSVLACIGVTAQSPTGAWWDGVGSGSGSGLLSRLLSLWGLLRLSPLWTRPRVLAFLLRLPFAPSLMRLVCGVPVHRDTPVCYSDIALDLARGQTTQVFYINGEIERLGRMHGVPTPLNSRLLALTVAASRGMVNEAATTPATQATEDTTTATKTAAAAGTSSTRSTSQSAGGGPSTSDSRPALPLGVLSLKALAVEVFAAAVTERKRRRDRRLGGFDIDARVSETQTRSVLLLCMSLLCLLAALLTATEGLRAWSMQHPAGTVGSGGHSGSANDDDGVTHIDLTQRRHAIDPSKRGFGPTRPNEPDADNVIHAWRSAPAAKAKKQPAFIGDDDEGGTDTGSDNANGYGGFDEDELTRSYLRYDTAGAVAGSDDAPASQ